MAPLPVNNTGRVWVDYRTGGGVTSQNHTAMIRYNPGVGGTFPEALTELCTALVTPGEGAYFDGWSILGARHAATGSDVSFPIPVPSVFLEFLGSGQLSASRQSQARETRFVGRSGVGGRRVSLSIYGLIDNHFTGADFRLSAAESVLASDVLAVLGEAETGSFVAIDNQPVVWYQYANWQFNSYWEGELRS